MKLSDNIQMIKPSITLEMSTQAAQLRAEGHMVISLNIGEPDYETPAVIKEAAIQAIRQRNLGYVNVSGVPELKEAIQTKFKRDNQLSYDLDEITVTAGAKQLIFNAMRTVLNPGDECLIPVPYWVSYPEMVKLCSAHSVLVPTTKANGYKMTPKALDAAITSRTRVMLFNSPSNPTGSVYTYDELKALGEVLEKHPDVAIICDDIYEHIYWADEPFYTLAQVCPSLQSRILIVNGVSKTYAMTGWRLGYGAGPKAWVKAINTMTSQVTTCTCIISQHAACAALNDARHSIAPMVETYRRRSEYMQDALSKLPGFDVHACHSTFYLFVDIAEFLEATDIKDDVSFCATLLSEEKISIVPGSAFGCVNHVRLSIATPVEVLEKAVERLQAFVSRHAPSLATTS